MTDAPVPGLPAPDRDELDAAEFVVREELAEGNLGLVDYSLPIVLAEYDRMRAELARWQEFLRPRDHSGDDRVDTPEAIQGRIDDETRRALAELSEARRRIDDLLAEAERRDLNARAYGSPQLAAISTSEIQRYLRPEGEE